MLNTGFSSVEPVTSRVVPSSFFILASSVCKSLQYLTSALTQEGEGHHLFRLTCSIVLWGGRNSANKCHWCVWGVLSVSEPYWVCPRSWCVCFPGVHCSGCRLLCKGTLFFFFFNFILFFKLYIIVLVLPNIKMNPPQVYMCSPS